MTQFNIEIDNGIAIIWLNDPTDKVNKLSSKMMGEFEGLLDRLEQDSEIKAAVLISGKADSFIVGADINELRALKTPEEARTLVAEAHRLFGRLENLAKPVVAAIHGAAMGGGTELVLACHYRLASDHVKTKLALPEVNLGLLPGAGGTQRLPRLVGLQRGLELMLSGKNVYPRQARRIGLVDALIHHHGLLEAAKRAATGLSEGSLKPKRNKLSARDKLLESAPLNRMVYQKAEESVRKRTHGNYPAPLKIIDCVKTGLSSGRQAGFEAEAKNFSQLLFTPQSKALIHLFFSKGGAEKNPYAEAEPLGTVGVLGAGLMGSGIAQVSAQGGYNVLLKDRDLTLAAKGKGAIWRDLSKRVGRGMSAFERDTVAERVVPLGEYSHFDKADVVIEAVVEDLELKRSVLAEIEAVNDSVIFASNTSAIPISQIAAGSRRPENVIGMHYFSPAQKMPLLEIIKTAKTPDWVLATAFELGLKQGKTVIVVNDSPGFYTTRILALFMNEAIALLEEGADIARVDKAMRDFGFPVGPFVLFDEVGIDVGAKINIVLKDFFAERGLSPSEAGQKLVEAGFKGRKNGRGFYKYAKGKKSKEVNEEVYRFFGGKTRKDIGEKEIQDRLALMMINEAVRCLEEGVLASPRDGDVGAVFGLGFPPFLGGPFWYLDSKGIRMVLGRLVQLSEAYGARFTPADLLRQHAEAGTTFYEH